LIKEDNNKMFKRGDVWLVDLGEVTMKSGSRQMGKRPVVIAGNNMGNTYAKILSVIPISSASTKLRKLLPTHVQLTPENSKIERDSVVMAEQTVVISKDQVIEKLFELDNELMTKIDIAIAIQFGLLNLARAM